MKQVNFRKMCPFVKKTKRDIFNKAIFTRNVDSQLINQLYK